MRREKYRATVEKLSIEDQNSISMYWQDKYDGEKESEKARRIAELYCGPNDFNCEIVSLFECKLESFGLTYSKTREIHVHLSIKRPKLNNIVVYRIYGLPFVVPPKIAELQNLTSDDKTQKISDILLPNAFRNVNDEFTVTQTSKLTTIELSDFPKFVFIKEGEVLGQFNQINQNFIFIDELTKPQFEVVNSTLVHFTKQFDKSIITTNEKCRIKILPSLKLILISTR